MRADTTLLTIIEAATMAGCGRTAAYAYVMSGQWPSVRIGRSIRVPKKGLELWIKESLEGPEAARANRNAEADRNAAKLALWDDLKVYIRAAANALPMSVVTARALLQKMKEVDGE